MLVTANDKKAGFIAVGSAITSYARNFTIRAAQKNYYGPNKRGFIYADTDSIHCDLTPSEMKGITVHDKNFCCWKLESCWDEGKFTRQKTYAEHIVAENCEKIESPYWNLKCAGMPDNCKSLVTYDNFDYGAEFDGKLMPKRIKGGVVLRETTYQIKEGKNILIFPSFYLVNEYFVSVVIL